MRRGQFQIARAAWLANSLDPLSFLGMFMSSDGRNDAAYSSVGFDHLVAEATIEPDLRLRNERLAQAEAVLLGDLPIIPIYHNGGATLVSRRVHGVVENATGFHLSRYISKD